MRQKRLTMDSDIKMIYLLLRSRNFIFGGSVMDSIIPADLLVALLGRLDPDDKAQLLAFVLACDLPAAGNGYINA